MRTKRTKLVDFYRDVDFDTLSPQSLAEQQQLCQAAGFNVGKFVSSRELFFYHKAIIQTAPTTERMLSKQQHTWAAPGEAALPEGLSSWRPLAIQVVREMTPVERITLQAGVLDTLNRWEHGGVKVR